MTQIDRSSIRAFLGQCLAGHNDEESFDDAESLLLSGRLDSLAVTQLVVFLEEQFAIDFGSQEFDVSALDSLESIAQFVERHGAVAAE